MVRKYRKLRRERKVAWALEVAKKIQKHFVIPSGARNLSWSFAHEKKERFLAPLGMTK
jgi:hypothetical protein